MHLQVVTTVGVLKEEHLELKALREERMALLSKCVAAVCSELWAVRMCSRSTLSASLAWVQ